MENILDCDCEFCDSRPVIPAIAKKILAGWERRLVFISSASGEEGIALPQASEVKGARIGTRHPPITPQAVHALRILARTNEPIPGELFGEILAINERSVKALMKEICDEWLIPVIATRKPPYGYWVASTAEEYLEWERVMRSQAISMLARCRRLFKANFPQLAGQEPFDFINQVSSELQEAIR